MTHSALSVISAPLLDPGTARLRFDVPCGSSIADIVARAFPHGAADFDNLRVFLVTNEGSALVDPRYWAHVQPKPHAQIVIRMVPGKDIFRSVLLAVVTIAASTFAGPIAGLLGVTSKVGISLVGAGLSVVGQLLVNALIPVSQPDPEEKRDVYRIDGWRNQMRPGSPVPFPLGRHRYAPPFAAQSYTEIVGDDQYVRALFCFGYGALRISDIRIGETPITDFQDYEIEIREGRDTDLPVSLYPQQVLEETAGVELTRPFPVDLSGEIIPDAASIQTPVTRFTAANSAFASVLIGFPQGLFFVDDKGRTTTWRTVVRIRARLNGVGAWTDVTTIDLTAKKTESFLRQHTWELPSRGRWQIEVTRISDEDVRTTVADTINLAAIQSIRPEYPINLDKPLALVAVRVRATRQLNGGLDAFNALVEREGQIHLNNAWSTGYGRTPATAFLAALMGPQNPYAVSEAGIDMDLIADWHDWCVLKGMKYDRVHDAPETLGEMLTAICAAGRATPRHDGVKWGVVIDRPETLVIDHINPRNSDQFGWSRGYFDPPDGIRVRFLDETNNYEEAERIVPRPGFTGDVEIAENLELPGKTDPAEIWIAARRRMYELMYRPDSFSAMQSGAVRVATRGDLVMGSFDVLTRTQLAARVKSVRGSLADLDEDIIIPEGYGMRFRVYEDDEDVIGTSLVRGIAATVEPTRAVRLTGTGAMPRVGEAVHIGPMDTESMALRVRGIEAAEDFQSRLIMVAAAPEIDTMLDAEDVPEWDGRVGVEVEGIVLSLAAPVFQSVSTGQVGTGDPGGLTVVLGPGAGTTAQLTSYQLDHRLAGTEPWTTIDIPSAGAGVSIDDYSAGNDVELQARAFSFATPGDVSAIATVTIGANDPAVPGSLNAQAITIIGSLGHATISVSVPTVDAPSQIQIYRAPFGVALDRDTHAVGTPLPVSPGGAVSYNDGDATRSNLISGGSFDSGASFTLGIDWAVASGKATHTPSSAGAISQALTLNAGTSYRMVVTALDVVAGTITPRLTGGTVVSGTALSTNGTALDRLTALSGNTAFELQASSDFDGSVDNLILFAETPTCLAAGGWSYWIEPQNSENIAGPVSGPVSVTIY